MAEDSEDAFGQPVPLPIDGVLDLHTIQPREIKDAVLAYLEACQEAGILEVRVIHGKGIGNLQRTVHALLTKHPQVVSFTQASELYGGRGATMVKLRKPMQTNPSITADILAAKDMNTAGIRTVCLALGPYRNLTTLTASILFLHPNCQVLNHAGERIFGDPRLDFLKDYSDAAFETFLRYALHISQSGQRGAHGGSITLSHAFDEQYPLHQIFKSTAGKLLKEDVRSLFWKESLLTARHIREQAVDLPSLFARNAKLKFLLPVRNPIDCAASNLKTGHVKHFRQLDRDSTIEQVLDAILDEFVWVEHLRANFPDRFLSFFEHDFGRSTLQRIAAFLELPPDETWIENALRAFEVKTHYQTSAALAASYRNSVERKFAGHPDFKAGLLAFMPGSMANSEVERAPKS